ncbi:putative glycolipid-binding domain-containing protein [Streptomyces sp. NPDC048172]|uniref:putative glycolipid-binding domain-containing protein n=1 Tax=Streptomyces sp. NPDC048172 TaxID=3365505 RepID=UPI003718B768
MTDTLVLTWDVIESVGHETAWVRFADDLNSFSAHGRAVGTTPEPYWISYELETGEGFVTRRLRVRAERADSTRTLELLHDGEGRWTANGAPVPDVDGALDCDLGLCPLTNTMPALRHGLHRSEGEREFLMAWVSVPDLGVHPSRQTYTHLGRTETGGARVRFASGTYRSDLEVDTDGTVVDYPGMARRLDARTVRTA